VGYTCGFVSAIKKMHSFVFCVKIQPSSAAQKLQHLYFDATKQTKSSMYSFAFFMIFGIIGLYL
jgi:hypothetical protein